MRLPLFAVLTALILQVHAVRAEETGSGRTQIRSQALDVINTDNGNRFVFSGSVRVEGADFTATCERMEVRTLADPEGGGGGFGAIEVIEATGSVTIVQGERRATAGRALIYPFENRVVLEDGPVIRDAEGTVSGHRMVLYGSDRRITVEAGPDGDLPTVELPSLRSLEDGTGGTPTDE